MADAWFTFLTELDAGRPRSSLKNCTSVDRCELERPPKCLPVRCETSQFDAVALACPDCTKTCSTTALNGQCPPQDPAGGLAYFVHGNDAHTITMTCPTGKVVNGNCNSDEFMVQCQDSGQISSGVCVETSECTNSGVRRDSSYAHDENNGKMLRKMPMIEEDQIVSKLLANADGCTYVSFCYQPHFLFRLVQCDLERENMKHMKHRY